MSGRSVFKSTTSFRVACAFLLSFGVFAAMVQLFWTATYPHRYRSERNPYFKRGWYDYVRYTPPRASDEELVIIISSSQGYGFEFPSKEAYPAVLQDLLQEEGRHCRVVNWSIHGGQYPDLLTLVAAARDKDPSALVIVLPPMFSGLAQSVPSAHDRWSSDAYHLLSDQRIREMLPRDIFRTITDASLILDYSLARAWAGWRIRNLPTAYLAERHPSLLPFFPEHSTFSWVGNPRRRFRRPRDAGRREAERPDPARACAFLGVASGVAPKVFLINMPIHASRPFRAQDAWAQLEACSSSLGIVPLDFRNAVPNNLYHTHAHFRAAGHRAMAERLQEVLP